jgi:hypothetical protein
MERARANGADIVLQGEGLHIVGRSNLSAPAIGYIREHSEAIVAYLRRETVGNGRSEKTTHPAGWLTEHQADELSRLLMASDPGDPDWTWFVSRAQKILDSVVMPQVAA